MWLEVMVEYKYCSVHQQNKEKIHMHMFQATYAEEAISKSTSIYDKSQDREDIICLNMINPRYNNAALIILVSSEKK